MGPLILPFRGVLPRIAASAFIAPGAVVVGDVEIGENASIWYGCVLRGDVAAISVGANANIQDGTVVHCRGGAPPTYIGADTTIGHLALVHGCRIEDGGFVGMKACVSDGAVVERDAMLAAGALLAPGKRVPSGELWAGTPARFMRALSAAERSTVRETPPHYVALAAEHKSLR